MTTRTNWLFGVLALAVLAASGCMTAAEYAGDPPRGAAGGGGARERIAAVVSSSATGQDEVVRLQSPSPDRLSRDAAQLPPALPPLPDPSLPEPGSHPASAPPAMPLDPPADQPPVAPPAVPMLDGTVTSPNPPWFRSLSSIARNRLANRVYIAPATDAGAAPAGVGRGPAASGAPGARPRSISSILRNRLVGGEEQEFNYPDIHDDPAKRYSERFGIDEDHDRFLFPWIMNSIFEDRWLLGESDPERATQNEFRRRMKVDIRDPDPDTANFPNGAYTLPKGRMYIETSPIGFYGASKTTPSIYQWEYLIRYGLTDNLEFRIFSNGLTAQASKGKQPATTGYSPLAFDFKANFWEENTRYFIPAMGLEVYLQTTFGSPSFDNGTQPSMNLLFDQSLPLGINLEYNLGIAGTRNAIGETEYEFVFQWSFQRQVVKDFDIFVHGFYNEASLPRLAQFQRVPNFQTVREQAAIPTATVVGVGAIWTVNNRLAIFGSYNFGLTAASPRTIALMGFAVGF